MCICIHRSVFYPLKIHFASRANIHSTTFKLEVQSIGTDFFFFFYFNAHFHYPPCVKILPAPTVGYIYLHRAILMLSRRSIHKLSNWKSLGNNYNFIETFFIKFNSYLPLPPSFFFSFLKQYSSTSSSSRPFFSAHCVFI